MRCQHGRDIIGCSLQSSRTQVRARKSTRRAEIIQKARARQRSTRACLHYGRCALLRLGIGSPPPHPCATLQRTRKLWKSYLHPRRAKLEGHASPAGGSRPLLPNLELPYVQEMDATAAHQGGLPSQAHPVFKDSRQVSNNCCVGIFFISHGLNHHSTHDLHACAHGQCRTNGQRCVLASSGACRRAHVATGCSGRCTHGAASSSGRCIHVGAAGSASRGAHAPTG